MGVDSYDNIPEVQNGENPIIRDFNQENTQAKPTHPELQEDVAPFGQCEGGGHWNGPSVCWLVPGPSDKHDTRVNSMRVPNRHHVGHNRHQSTITLGRCRSRANRIISSQTMLPIQNNQLW